MVVNEPVDVPEAPVDPSGPPVIENKVVAPPAMKAEPVPDDVQMQDDADAVGMTSRLPAGDAPVDETASGSETTNSGK